ncbi:TPA: hypothetical protein I7721_22780 [Vibrio vulnificus]|nr:hypothetical protein [Vibrio vulnificus]
MSALEVAELMPETVPPEPPETHVVEMYRPAGNTVRREQVHVSAETENNYDYAFENAVAQFDERRKKNTI